MSDLIAGTDVQDRYARYDRATADLDPPFAVVDLAAFDSNARDLVRRSSGVPIRVVSKSLRCRHLIERALAQPGYRGVPAGQVVQIGTWRSPLRSPGCRRRSGRPGCG